jgi:hypothetical protein
LLSYQEKTGNGNKSGNQDLISKILESKWNHPLKEEGKGRSRKEIT